MESFHGTSKKNAAEMLAKGVDVTCGGGELGRGFYSGEHLHEAKAWAFHRSGDRQQNVVQFSVPDDQVDVLNFKLLDHEQAGKWRYYIKQNSRTRTYLFAADMVWAPIVGSERATGDQYKWESQTAQSLLNAPVTIKKIV